MRETRAAASKYLTNLLCGVPTWSKSVHRGWKLSERLQVGLGIGLGHTGRRAGVPLHNYWDSLLNPMLSLPRRSQEHACEYPRGIELL